MAHKIPRPPFSIDLPLGLLLREFRSIDIPQVHTILADVETVGDLPHFHDQTLDKTTKLCEEFIATCGKSSWMFAIIEVSSQKLIGIGGFRQFVDLKIPGWPPKGEETSDEILEGNIQLVLYRSVWNRGYGTQVFKAIVDFGWQIGLQQIAFGTLAENKALSAIAKKMGW